MTKVNTTTKKQEGTMNSADEFYYRYYCNRLLREGYIDEKEYQALLSFPDLTTTTPRKRANVKSSLAR